MAAAACAAKPSARMRAPATEGGSVTIRGIWYYFGLAALAWIVHPLALAAASLFVLRELHRREFRSEMRDAVRQRH
jgi:uncharacterized membrane protein